MARIILEALWIDIYGCPRFSLGSHVSPGTEVNARTTGNHGGERRYGRKIGDLDDHAGDKGSCEVIDTRPEKAITPGAENASGFLQGRGGGHEQGIGGEISRCEQGEWFGQMIGRCDMSYLKQRLAVSCVEDLSGRLSRQGHRTGIEQKELEAAGSAAAT